MAYQNSILSRPLSVYSIPPELLAALSVRSIQQAQGGDEPTTEAETREPETTQMQQPAGSTSGLGCQTCPGAIFSTPEDQRAHFKSDWHRYNAKAKLNNGKAVAEAEFDNLDSER